MSSSAFEQASALGSEFPDGWQQGRGAFGGLVIGTMTRAVLAAEPGEGRSLRSLTADLCGPAMPGPYELVITPLRRGANISFVEARIVQGKGVVARASFTLAGARDIPKPTIPTPPPIFPVPYTEVHVLPLGPPFGPRFATHYELRSTGPTPFSSAPEAIAEGWVNEKERGALDEAAIVALLDAWYPAVFTIETQPRMAATIQFTAELFIDPKKTPLEREPLFFRGRGIAGSDNYYLETRELWTKEGLLVAMNQQTFALLT